MSGEMQAYRMMAHLLIASMPRETRRELEDAKKRIQEVVKGAGELGEIALLSVTIGMLDDDAQKGDA